MIVPDGDKRDADVGVLSGFQREWQFGTLLGDAMFWSAGGEPKNTDPDRSLVIRDGPLGPGVGTTIANAKQETSRTTRLPRDVRGDAQSRAEGLGRPCDRAPMMLALHRRADSCLC